MQSVACKSMSRFKNFKFCFTVNFMSGPPLLVLIACSVIVQIKLYLDEF